MLNREYLVKKNISAAVRNQLHSETNSHPGIACYPPGGLI
jgi:hypothetical protein